MKKLFLLFITLFTGFALISAPVYADEGDSNCVKTSIIGNGEVCDDGKGSSIYDILGTVVDIMSVCVGIVGVIGITIVGLQYLTAGGNEEQTRKAKRRMFEIVIGIVAYVILYAGLRWLLPGFNGTSQPNSESNSSQETTQQENTQQEKTKDRL